MKSSFLKRNGHERYRVVHADRNKSAQERRKKALEALEYQLATNKKSDKETGKLIPLEKPDIERIKREIVSLKIKLSIV